MTQARRTNYEKLEETYDGRGAKFIALTDPEAARELQKTLNLTSGKYCTDKFSCRTYVEDIIEAGGGKLPSGDYESDYGGNLKSWFNALECKFNKD